MRDIERKQQLIENVVRKASEEVILDLGGRKDERSQLSKVLEENPEDNMAGGRAQELAGADVSDMAGVTDASKGEGS